MKYKILFIDEEKDQHDCFKNYMDKVDDKVTVKCLYPLEDMKQMLELIEEEHPDAIVSDFLLNEIKTDIKYNVSYNGSELVNEYRTMRPNFPCFVLTSFDEDAVDNANDVNLVYVKNILHGGENNKNTSNDLKIKVKLCDKIIIQIGKYKRFIEEAQAELTQLLDKKNNKGLSLHEEDRLVQLDSFLEKSLDSYTSLPDDVKKSENMNKLSTMIDKVDEMLQKLG